MKPILFALVVVGLFGILRLARAELVDFAVPRTAAARFIAHEPLYRPDDQHYQYKYFPAFALAMVPFTWMPRGTAEFTWFTLTVAMAWALVHLSIAWLPDRRASRRALFWLTLLLTGKFFVKELGFGQFNLPVALLMLGAVVAAQGGRVTTASALIAVAVFVKPYALVLVPWLAWRWGWRPLVPFGMILAAGLMLPAAWYGWSGNVTLLHEWYRTVTETTGPNLLGPDNISFASMWAKWIGPGRPAAALALVSSVVSVVAGIVLILKSRRVPTPYYLEVAYFLVLVSLLSPQGWDYTLVIALPAYVCLVDRWADMTPGWRAVGAVGIFFTSFTIFDLLRRPLFTLLMQWSAISVGALLIAICLIHLRYRELA